MVNVNRIGGPSNFQQPETRSDQYLTQPGDTMAGVADYFGVNPQTLAAANAFIANPNGPLPPGVYLAIPKKAEAPPLKPREDDRERERERGGRDEEREEGLSSANRETVTNNPVANTKRNYELSRGELSLAALSLASYAPSLTANPATTGKFTREHLLCDAAFINKTCMESGEIQKLFHEKGSGLATFLVSDGRSAAQFIAAASTAEGLNPQVLLTLLQLEGGFISGRYAMAIDRERLDWAFGLGADKVEKLRGFDRQVETMTRRLRESYESNLQRAPSHIMLDGKRQKAENAATMTICQLAPQKTLIKLFYDIWRGFFGSDGLGRAR